MQSAFAFFAAGMNAGVLFAATMAEDVEMRTAVAAFLNPDLVQAFALDAKYSPACFGHGFRAG
jgi:hypothetical protein